MTHVHQEIEANTETQTNTIGITVTIDPPAKCNNITQTPIPTPRGIVYVGSWQSQRITGLRTKFSACSAEQYLSPYVRKKMVEVDKLSIFRDSEFYQNVLAWSGPHVLTANTCGSREEAVCCIGIPWCLSLLVAHGRSTVAQLGL